MGPSASRVRWEVADASAPGGQLALFAEPERVIGRGEYRGLEFVHVRARTILNRVPESSPVPFRWTINAYRGCSHACTYCLSGDTPVLMADGRTKPIAEVRKGDRVYGTVRRGAYRRYVITEVVDHWSTVKAAYRVTLADGTELVTSEDHRFLTDRGWKHVTGAEQGRLRRPHLTTANRLIGTGHFTSPPEHDADYRKGYLCGLIRGDGHIGHYAYKRPGRTRGDVHRFRLALIDLEALQRARTYLSGHGIETKEFEFPVAVGGTPMRAIRTSARAAVTNIEDVVAWPDPPSDQWCAGFLAGIFDAEGGYSRGILRISNTDREIINEIAASLRRFGFRFVIETSRRPKPVLCVRILGGRPEHLRFFLRTDPAITRKRTIAGMALKCNAGLRVVSVEALGVHLPMYDITTGTGDFIADGVVSHNCFARPTHEYLGLDPTSDFDRVIVVKLNAVDRLRAELAPSRWAGEHIAMGTNTDPYQRAEGKYRLTRGIVEVLSAAGNPFSILTKSTLVLRDLDLLAEAAGAAHVECCFSIGTLDEEVWRVTEPGTPHPRKRLEAVARLNDAGVPCGVLIAPVIPGLSDTPAQLDAVARGAVEAGARSINPVVLHLRRGVREHWFASLDDRPELAAHHTALYRRGAYAPSAERERVTELVRRAVARHRRRLPGQAPEPRMSARFDPAGP